MTHQIECIDESNGHQYTALIESSSLKHAKIRAVNEGHTVLGMEHLKPAAPKEATVADTDFGFRVITLLVPIIGFSIGVIRAGTNRPGAWPLLWTSILGFILWALIFSVKFG